MVSLYGVFVKKITILESIFRGWLIHESANTQVYRVVNSLLHLVTITEIHLVQD